MFSPSTGQRIRQHNRIWVGLRHAKGRAQPPLHFLQRHVTRMHLLGVQLRRSYIGGQRIAPCQFQVLLDGRLLTFHPQAVTFFL